MSREQQLVESHFLQGCHIQMKEKGRLHKNDQNNVRETLKFEQKSRTSLIKRSVPSKQ